MRRWLPVLLRAGSLQAAAQQGSLNGQVTEDDSPVQGVVLRNEGTPYGDTTVASGRLLIRDLAGGTCTLAAELAGYPPLVRWVTVAEGAGTAAFRYESDGATNTTTCRLGNIAVH